MSVGLPYAAVGWDCAAVPSKEMQEINEEFGPSLKHYRLQARDPENGGPLTQARLAELADCGISAAMIGHWETGRRAIRREDRLTLQRLIAVLHQGGGLQSLDEANGLLESGLYSRLTPEETADIDPAWLEETAASPGPDRIAESPVALVLSPRAVYEWLDSLFRWSEADDHARSSWAGMFIWSLAALTGRLTPDRWFHLLSFFILWVVSWLIAPLLNWPLNDPSLRLEAAVKFALASIAVPVGVAFLSSPDTPARKDATTPGRTSVVFLLKLAGAVVGFNMMAVLLLLLALGLFYLDLGAGLSVWIWRLALLAPLLMAHVGARRIPADRHKMYEGELRLHEADAPFLATYLLLGAALGGFVYVYHDLLASKATGASFLVVAAGLALWHRQKRWPTPAMIFTLGTLAPFLILCLFLFVFPSPQAADSMARLDVVTLVSAFLYVLSLTTMAVTVLLGDGATLTLRGALGLLLVLLFVWALAQLGTAWGVGGALLALALWLGWGQRNFARYFWLHGSAVALFGALAVSIGLQLQSALPPWPILGGYAALAGGLIFWAYSAGSQAGRRHTV